MAKKAVEDYIIDFNEEEESGGTGNRRFKEDTYKVKVVSAKPTKSANKGTRGLEVTFQFQEGRYKGKKITDTLWVAKKAYGRFRSLLEAVGEDVPTKIGLLKIAKAIKGGTLYVEIEDDAQEGYKTRSRVGFDGFIHEDDYDPDDSDVDEDEEEDEEEEDEEEEEEEEEDDDEEEDDEDEEDEEDEEEEEEEEPAPKKRRRTKKAKPAAKKRPAKKASSRKKKKSSDDDEDLEELDLEDF